MRRLFAGLVAVAMLALALTASPSSTAAPTPATAKLGATVSGKLVNPAGNPVHGIKIVILDALDRDVLGRDTTGIGGRFRVDGITHEEIAIRIDGSARGYQKGYLGCAMRVVPTFGDACTFSPTALGLILIKRV